jgi:RNA polymerase sigma-70 factor (ECF subfamily)
VAAVVVDLRPEIPVEVPDALGDLAALARAGDRRAMEDLLRASYDVVYPICRRIVGNPTDAADAAQEALMSVVRGLPRFDGRSRYSTWVYRIAMNAAIDETRRRARRPVVGITPGFDAPSTSPGADPEGGLTMMDVEQALVGLPLDYRSAVVLRDVCGLDYAEIAEILGVPGGTVRSRIARGRSLLAGRLGPTLEASS